WETPRRQYLSLSRRSSRTNIPYALSLPESRVQFTGPEVADKTYLAAAPQVRGIRGRDQSSRYDSAIPCAGAIAQTGAPSCDRGLRAAACGREVERLRLGRVVHFSNSSFCFGSSWSKIKVSGVFPAAAIHSSNFSS